MIRATLALSALAFLAALACAEPGPGPVLLTEIQALTLRRGALTTARRGAAMPQLTCRGPHCAAHEPDVVQCINQGTDGVGVQWSCKADMPEWMRFGVMDVSCEGYARPGDAYVLGGSCALTYELVGSAPAPRRNHYEAPPSYHDAPRVYGQPHAAASNVDTIMLFITIAVFAVIVILVAAACAHAGRHDPSTTTTRVVVEPAAPAYGPAPAAYVAAAPAAPSVVYVDGMRHRSPDRFVEGVVFGSAMSGGGSSCSRPSTHTEHHYHSAPAAAPARSPSPPRTVTKEGYASTTVR